MMRFDYYKRHARTRLALLAGLVLLPLASVAQDDAWGDDPWASENVSPWSWYGFVEGAAGGRTDENPLIDEDMPLGELRLQVEGEYQGDGATWDFKLDGIADGVEDDFTGNVREAKVSFSLGERTDVRAGRQILTWGTGDLVFLNDLFPKDWVSFLSGRDREYLKAPSDALRTSWFGEDVNVDVALLPFREPDVYIDGTRLSYWNPGAGSRVAAPPKLRTTEPARTVENSEAAMRVYGMAGDQEWAVYGYRGFAGQPEAVDTDTGRPTFARLDSLGASLRGPLGDALYNLEFAYHNSPDDPDGDDPRVPNDELRFLTGYKREAFTNFNVGVQYYLEWMQDYDAFRQTYPFAADERPEEERHVVTLRLTWRLMRDNLVLGLMNFHSPNEEDSFIRPTVEYRITDQLYFNTGANLFEGQSPATFYGQFEPDSSVYARLRYNF